MDLTSLLSALSNADKQAQADAPYALFKGVSDQVGADILKQAPSRNMKDSLIGGLLVGALGGLADRGNESYINNQNQMALDSVQGILSGLNPSRPAGMNPGIFGQLQNVGKVVNWENQLAANAENRKAANDLQNSILTTRMKAYYDNPYQAAKGEAALAAQSQPAAAPMVKTELDPYLERFGGDEAAARSALEYDRQAPERLATLRKEFESKQEVKNFVLADVGWRSMQQAFQDQSGTSDVELIRAGIQAIEPGLAVRTDDQTAVKESTSIPDAWKTAIGSALTGESKLPAAVRAGLMRIAARRHAEWSSNFVTAKDFYETQAKQSGLDPSGISYIGDVQPGDESLYPDPSANTPPPGTPPIPAGYEFVGVNPSTGKPQIRPIK